MAGTWLADECRRQAVLFLAASACSQRDGSVESGAVFPFPLLAAEGPVSGSLRARAAELAGTGSLTGLDATVGRLFEELDEASQGLPARPWTFAELVGWWLAAGEKLAGLGTHQRSTLARITGTGDDCLHPALWCAERLTRLKISAAAFQTEVEPVTAWNDRGNSPWEYRFRLFKWVVSPDRVRPGFADRRKQPKVWLAALQAEMRDIRQDLAALFGRHGGLRVGGELTLQTSDRWIAIWTAGRLGERLINEVRGPVIQGTDRGELTGIRGVAVLPPTQTLCMELVDRQAAVPGGWDAVGDGSGMLKRATDFAAARWQPGALVSAAWSKPIAGVAAPLPVEKIEPSFLAVARWLTTASLVADPDLPRGGGGADAGELIATMQVALALEGFQVTESRGGLLSQRIIPTAAAVRQHGVTLVLSREASGFEALLGRVGETASCGPALFAAIEAVDWRLWAFRTAPWDPTDDVSRKVAEIVQARVARSEDWEGVKQQALHTTTAGTDTEPLGRLFRHAHERRLALELLRDRVYRSKPADAMLSGLIAEYRSLAMEALAALAEIDPTAPGQLDPPRLGTGAIDVLRWMGRPGAARGEAGRYQPRWIQSRQPRGEVVDEARTGSGPEIGVVISAGDADEADLVVLNAPLLPADKTDHAHHRLGELLATCQQRLAFHAASDLPEDGTSPLDELRLALTGDDAASFHELLERCRSGDAAALAWCRLLRDQARFRFACHPDLDIETGTLAPPQLADPYLVWEYDAVAPPGQDLAITFALEPAAARRVISRGCRQPGSPSACAEDLAHACCNAGGGFARLGEAAVQATDRWQTFGVEVDHPIRAAEEILDHLLEGQTVEAAHRNAIFEAAARWCGSLDHELLPTAWRAEGRLSPTAFTDLELLPDYDEEAPTGTVVVRRFGLRGVHGRPFSGAVSAGPRPAGFADFRAAVRDCQDASERGVDQAFGEVLRRTDELAKHSLAGTLSLALPNLFDQVWGCNSAAAAKESPSPAEAVTKPLFEMLKAACRMVPFEPQTIGEYSAGWVRERDGSQPRGRRIKRLVRPGLRTVENVLVRPALVITE